jgi:AraC family cel operon transcriptional repressor
MDGRRDEMRDEIDKDLNLKIVCLSLPDLDIKCGVSYLHQKSVSETYPLHTHDFYEIFYVMEGKAIHEVNGETLVLTKGALIFIRPSDTHQYKFINNHDMEILSIGIENKIVENVCNFIEIDLSEFHKFKSPPMIKLEGSHCWDMIQKLQLISKKERGIERRRYFMSIFPEIVYHLYYHADYQEDTIIPIWFSHMIDEMANKDNYLQGLTRMIELANVSQEHLTRGFKRYLGITPTEFINIKRINYGAELLLEGKYSILEICYMCGFNNLSYFYKIFEKYYKYTPKKFLKSHSIDELI